VRLVVADDHKGLRAAAAKVFSATHQRCRVHWLRNALAHVPPKQRPAVVAMLKTIFAQDSAEAACEQWASVADALRERFPKLAELMDGAREDVLAYMTFPREHWPQIASTNPLERLNGEIKRRADVIGIFPNDRAVVRLVGALMLEQNDEWAVSRRYMSLESLAALSDDPRPQAVRRGRLITLEPCRDRGAPHTTHGTRPHLTAHECLYLTLVNQSAVAVSDPGTRLSRFVVSGRLISITASSPAWRFKARHHLPAIISSCGCHRRRLARASSANASITGVRDLRGAPSWSFRPREVAGFD
jgi:hypothetical protein